MRKSVVILSGIPITNNPRTVKEADALSELGYSVEVLGAIHDERSKEEVAALMEGRLWRHTSIADLSDRRILPSAMQMWQRARAKGERQLGRHLGLETPLQLGFLTRALYKAAKDRKAGLYSLHAEQALWAGRRLLRDGRAVCLDVEDWYSEDGLPKDIASRPRRLLRACENELLRNASFTVTTSHTMANRLSAEYGCRAPSVVYNSFPSSERNAIDGLRLDRHPASRPSIAWFSQTIGPGRGLELLTAALSRIELPFELHLRGQPARGYLETLLGPLDPALRSRIFIHSRVRQAELLSRLSEHDIGYCGEFAYCRSRDLTITNKLFEYMRAGLAIVATDTAGQKEAAAKAPDCVSIVRQDSVEEHIKAFSTLLSDRDRLAKAKAASAKALDLHFGWSQSKQVIQSLAARHFESQAREPEPSN